MSLLAEFAGIDGLELAVSDELARRIIAAPTPRIDEQILASYLESVARYVPTQQVALAQARRFLVDCFFEFIGQTGKLDLVILFHGTPGLTTTKLPLRYRMEDDGMAIDLMERVNEKYFGCGRIDRLYSLYQGKTREDVVCDTSVRYERSLRFEMQKRAALRLLDSSKVSYLLAMDIFSFRKLFEQQQGYLESGFLRDENYVLIFSQVLHIPDLARRSFSLLKKNFAYKK